MVTTIASSPPSSSSMDEETVALSGGDVFTLERLHRTRGLSRLHGVNVDEIAARGQLRILQLLCEHAAATLTTNAIDQAAANGHLDVVQYLHSTRHAPCTTEALDSAAENGHWEVVDYLLTTNDDEWEIVDTSLNQTQAALCTSRVMDTAALDGRLDLVHRFHRAGLPCSTWAMDYAAACGHLDVVQFLHTNRTEGCTTRAMDEAAKGRHLDIVRFLHTHRTEGCSTDAMDHAVANGDLEMVRFLHTHRHEGCTTNAIDHAAAHGHVAVVQFLLWNRSEGFTCQAVEMAAKPGCEKQLRGEQFRSQIWTRIADHRHVQILRMLFRVRPDFFDPPILSSLLLCGAFDLWLELRPLGSALPSIPFDRWGDFPENTGEESAMMLAGERGHLSTIRFLREVQSRRDLLPLAVTSAANERPSWLTAMHRDDPDSAYSFALYHTNETSRAPCEPWAPTSFFLEEGIPDWMIEQALIDYDLKQQHLLGDEYPCHWTWPIWAIYRDDLVALEVIRNLEASADYMCDPRFSFEDARSHAVRVGSLDLLQWLFEKIPHVAIEPTLLDDAIFYGRLEIAKWLAHYQPDACLEFPGAKAWPLAPLGVRLNATLLDELERDPRLRVLVDFGAMAAYAAEQHNLSLLQRLYTRYPASVLARRDLVDRTVVLNGGCCDLSILKFLKEIGYSHASALAVDSVTSDSQLAILQFLYENYPNSDSPLRALVTAARQCSWKIVLFHLEHRGLSESERDALSEIVAANVGEDWARTLGYVVLAQQEKEDRELNAEWLSDSDM